MAGIPIIESRGLEKKYGALCAVDSVSIQVHPGECFGLLGPNGAGKSTFIAMVYGVARRTGGSLHVFGLDPHTQARQIKMRTGVVTQENALDEELTVGENMLIYAAFQGIPVAERQARVDSLLEYMQLSHKKDAEIRALSGGMKRRLVFVRALLNKPELLVLDEPTTGLDPAVRHLLWSKVKQLQSEGTTILLTTHYMHEAEVLCDRVAILDGGKVVDTDTPRRLIEKHAPGYVSVYGAEHEGCIDNWVLEGSGLRKFRSSSVVYLVAPSLEQLVALSNAGNALPQGRVLPQLMRPANLEDVFLRVTKQELSTDA